MTVTGDFTNSRSSPSVNILEVDRKYTANAALSLLDNRQVIIDFDYTCHLLLS